jgi:hypothetical protein
VAVPGRGLHKALDRLGIAYDEHTTGGAKGAARALEAVLAERGTALIWPDLHHLGYWQLPESMDGRGGHPVVVYGQRGDRMYLDDRNLRPRRSSGACVSSSNGSLPWRPR